LFKAGIKLEVVKTLCLQKQEASNDYGDLPSVLTGNSAIFISDVANAPGKIIKISEKNQQTCFKRELNLKFILEMIN
jgi:large subunit ribosomal protein L10